MIRLKNVCKTYKSKKGTNTQVLKYISINFPEKGIVCITGKSGSGKSTLLNVIGGLDKYDSGDIIIEGKSTKKFTEKNFDDYRNTYIGFIFQEFNLLEEYSIGDNIKLSLKLQNKKVNKEEIEQVLNKVGLENIQNRKVNELSGGQKQRVSIARALIKNPKVILADEPTGNLDSNTSRQIWDILKDLSKDRLVIIVTHDIESSNKYADYEIKIKDGEIEENVNITDNESKNENIKFKSAKLPFLYNLKMSFEVISHKKISLLVTTLLIVFSIICFSIMLFGKKSDLNSKVYQLFANDGEDYVQIENYEDIKNKTAEYSILNNNYNEIKRVEINDSLKNQVERKTGIKFSKSWKQENDFTSFIYPPSSKSNLDLPVYYYAGSEAFPACFVDNTDAKIDNLIGENATNENEVVISSYLADLIIYNSCYAKDNLDKNTKEKIFSPKNYNELISKDLYVNFYNLAYLKIVGIYDVSNILSKEDFEQFKRNSMVELNWTNDTVILQNEMYKYIENFTIYMYVTPSCIEKINSKENNVKVINTKIQYNNNVYSNETIAYILDDADVYTNEGIKKIKNLNKNEVVISEYLLDRITDGKYFKDYDKNINYYESKEDYLKKYLRDNNVIGKKIKTNVSSNGVINQGDIINNEYIISGIIDDTETSIMYYNKDNIKSLMGKQLQCMALITKVNSVDQMKMILNFYPIDNAKVISSSTSINKVLNLSVIIYFIEYISKYGVIFFLLFTIFIFMNFINSSIKLRKKEIGILRALGCKSKDIIKMFLTESAIIMIISLIITYFTIPLIISAVNNFISYNLIIVKIDAITFDTQQMLIISFLMLAITIIANIIPIRKITKMKPVDIIFNK